MYYFIKMLVDYLYFISGFWSYENSFVYYNVGGIIKVNRQVYMYFAGSNSKQQISSEK